MAGAQTYKELLIWQKGMELAETVYKITADFPTSEVYALTNQIRRSAVSVPSNVAEGYGRKSNASFAQYLRIARGSLYEMETQLILANRINYIKNDKLLDVAFTMIEEEGKMLNTFLKRLED